MSALIVEIILNTFVNSIIFTGLVLVLLLFLRRSAAETRYLALTFSLYLLLFMPLITALTPALKFSRVTELIVKGPDSNSVSMTDGNITATPVVVTKNYSPVLGDVENQPQIINSSGQNSPEISQSAINLLMSLWAAGFLTLILVNLIQSRRVREILKPGKSVNHDWLQTTAAKIKRSYGITRSVKVITSPHIASPLVWGIKKPCIALPSDFKKWEQDKVRAILYHELAHVARRDNLLSMISLLIATFYWMNPLVWVILRKINIEKEAACDDRAINTGLIPSRYAEYLLDILSSMQNKRLYALSNTASYASQTKERFMRILSPKINRKPVRPVIIILVFVIVAGLALPVAAFRPLPVRNSSDDTVGSSSKLIQIDENVQLNEEKDGKRKIVISGSGEIHHNNPFPATCYYSDDFASADDSLFSEEYYRNLKKQPGRKIISEDDNLKSIKENMLMAFTEGSYSSLADGRLKLTAVLIYDESKNWQIWGKDVILSDENGDIEWELLEPESEIMVTRKIDNMELKFIVGENLDKPLFLIDNASYPFEERQLEEFKHMVKKAYIILK